MFTMLVESGAGQKVFYLVESGLLVVANNKALPIRCRLSTHYEGGGGGGGGGVGCGEGSGECGEGSGECGLGSG